VERVGGVGGEGPIGWAEWLVFYIILNISPYLD